MTPDEFRRYGHAVVDWIADYQSRASSRFRCSRRRSQERFALRCRESSERRAKPFDDVLKDVETRYFAGRHALAVAEFLCVFPCNASGPGILGDLVSSGLGVQGMLWSTSPACTELETHVMDWLVGMLGLPEKFRL